MTQSDSIWRMEENDDIELSDIGAALIEAAKSDYGTARDILRELYPYVDEASQRMSSRAISQFLKDNFEVQVSPASILRALRNPDRHWEDFSEYIEGSARLVEAAMEVPMDVFLFDSDVFSHIRQKTPLLNAVDAEDAREEIGEIDEAMAFLDRKWFSLPPKARIKCKRFFISDNPELEKEENG